MSSDSSVSFMNDDERSKRFFLQRDILRDMIEDRMRIYYKDNTLIDEVLDKFDNMVSNNVIPANMGLYEQGRIYTFMFEPYYCFVVYVTRDKPTGGATSTSKDDAIQIAKYLTTENLDITRNFQQYKGVTLILGRPPSSDASEILSHFTRGKLHLSIMLGSNFTMNPLKHVLQPKYQLIDEKDEIQLLYEYGALMNKNPKALDIVTAKSKFPKLQKTEIRARWLDLEPGRIMKFIRKSGVIYYRVVV